MSDRYLLGIDAGQTAVKAVLHTSKLEPIASARRPSPLARSTARYVERSQDQLWDTAAEAIAEVVAVSAVAPGDIAAVAVTGHGDGLHLVDRAGKPVGNAITAMDSRAHRQVAQILADPARAQRILHLSGQIPSVGSTGVLLGWLVENAPELIEAAHALLFCKDVIRLRLTGEIATDLSDASASFLETAEARWSSQVLADYGAAGLERLLPDLLRSTDIAGHVTAEAAERCGLAAGTPVVAGSHDVQAATLGMGALVPGHLTLQAGSFSINGVTTTEPHVDPRWQSRLSIRPDLRVAMSTSATASSSLEWLLRTLGVRSADGRDRLFAEAAQLNPEEHVPLTLPFLYTSPLGDSPSATLLGLRGWHSPAHILRGTLEGIVLMHYWHTSALAEQFSWSQPVRLAGGMSHAPLYVQLVANALRSPIEVVGTEESGAWGAAAMGGMAAGIFDSVEQAQELVRSSGSTDPTDASAAYWDGVTAEFTEAIRDLDNWWTNRERSQR